MSLFGSSGILSNLFTGTPNANGTKDYLGGLINYDPKRDIAPDDRFGLFGSALKDIGADLGGHPADAGNLDAFTRAAQAQRANQALRALLSGGATDPTYPWSGQSQAIAGNAGATLAPIPGKIGNGSPDFSGGSISNAIAAGLDPALALNLFLKGQDRADKQVTTLSPQDAVAAGLPKGDVAQRDAFGGLNVVSKTDAMSPEAFGQKKAIETLSQAPQWANVALGKQRLALDQQKQSEGGLDPQTIYFAAAQYNIDHKMPALGRTANGRAQILNEAARQLVSKGIAPEKAMARVAEYQGTLAGEKTLGQRAAQASLAVNEFVPMVGLAQQAMAKVSRSGFLPLGQLQQAYEHNTNDPNLRAAVAANNAVINTYARAINPNGVPTVDDKQHAREMLNTAYDQASYNAVLDQMSKEAAAALKSPEKSREELRGAIEGGYGYAPDQPAAAPNTAAPKVGTVQGGYMFKGGNPADPHSWVKTQ